MPDVVGNSPCRASTDKPPPLVNKSRSCSLLAPRQTSREAFPVWAAPISPMPCQRGALFLLGKLHGVDKQD